MVVKLWHCACPCNTAFPGSVAVLMAATFPVWDPAPWFWRQQGISYFQRTVFALYCLGAARRNGHKVTAFVSSNRELTRDEKWWTFLENTVRESNKSQPPGKRFQWRHKRVLKAWEEKLRKEFLWEIRPFKSTYVYWRTEKAKRGPGQDACWEKSWEHHLWLTSMPTSNRKWRLRQICKQNGQILKDCPSTELTCKDWKFLYCFPPSLSAFLLTPGTQGNLLSKHQLNTS